MGMNMYRDDDKGYNPSLKDKIKMNWETSIIHDLLVDPIKRANAISKVSKFIKKLDVNDPNAKEILAKIDKIIYGYDLHTDQFGSPLEDEILDMWKAKKAAIEEKEKVAEQQESKTTKKESSASEEEKDAQEIEKE